MVVETFDVSYAPGGTVIKHKNIKSGCGNCCLCGGGGCTWSVSKLIVSWVVITVAMTCAVLGVTGILVSREIANSGYDKNSDEIGSHVSTAFTDLFESAASTANSLREISGGEYSTSCTAAGLFSNLSLPWCSKAADIPDQIPLLYEVIRANDKVYGASWSTNIDKTNGSNVMMFNDASGLFFVICGDESMTLQTVYVLPSAYGSLVYEFRTLFPRTLWWNNSGWFMGAPSVYTYNGTKVLMVSYAWAYPERTDRYNFDQMTMTLRVDALQAMASALVVTDNSVVAVVTASGKAVALSEGNISVIGANGTMLRLHEMTGTTAGRVAKDCLAHKYATYAAAPKSFSCESGGEKWLIRIHSEQLNAASAEYLTLVMTPNKDVFEDSDILMQVIIGVSVGFAVLGVGATIVFAVHFDSEINRLVRRISCRAIPTDGIHSASPKSSFACGSMFTEIQNVEDAASILSSNLKKVARFFQKPLFNSILSGDRLASEGSTIITEIATLTLRVAGPTVWDLPDTSRGEYMRTIAGMVDLYCETVTSHGGKITHVYGNGIDAFWMSKQATYDAAVTASLIVAAKTVTPSSVTHELCSINSASGTGSVSGLPSIGPPSLVATALPLLSSSDQTPPALAGALYTKACIARGSDTVGMMGSRNLMWYGTYGAATADAALMQEIHSVTHPCVLSTTSVVDNIKLLQEQDPSMLPFEWKVIGNCQMYTSKCVHELMQLPIALAI